MDYLHALPVAVAGVVLGLIAGVVLGLVIWRKSTAQKLAALVALEQVKLREANAAAVHKLEQDAATALARAREAMTATFGEERRQLAALRTQWDDGRTQLDQARAEAKSDEQRLERRETKLSAREQFLGERERDLDQRQAAVDRRDATLRTKEETLTTRDQDLSARGETLTTRERSIDERLAAIAGMTPAAAKDELLARLDAQLGVEQSERIARLEKDLSLRAKDLGIELVSRAIQRYAAEHTAETTSAKVKLADDEMKGRIIGKEGRNIKTFEQLTGVDVIIDDTPQTITISCFDGVRREIAKRTLLILLEDGRVHPARIEEVLAQVQQDMDRETLKLGEDAAFAVDVSGLHPQLLRLLGKLQFRTSYGQNVLKHTQEVAFLCGALAADLGLDAKLGRRCGLMHDIGKAIDHEQEGSHPVLGYEALKRYGESELVANAALAHHEGHAVLTPYTVLAAAADAISAARPGARHNNVENYLKRLAQLEEIACSFPGVHKAYAIQAGRELRVIVNGHSVPDAIMAKVAHDIARRIEGEVSYPGEVKVTLIREMRQIAVAR